MYLKTKILAKFKSSHDDQNDALTTIQQNKRKETLKERNGRDA
jgi:hypothetical protein